MPDLTVSIPSPGLTARTAARTRRVRVPLLLGLTATSFSLLGSWNASLWTDEAVTVSAASRSWASLGQLLGSVDAVHGAYYAVMHLWGGLFGLSPLMLRLPSALAVGAAAAGMYFLGRRLTGPRAGVAAAVVFALLPRVTWMGMEGRSFAFSTAAVVALGCLLTAAVVRGGRRYFAAYAVVAGTGAVLNIYVLLAVAALGLSLFLLPAARHARLPALAASIGGGLLASPVLLAAAGQRGQLGTPDLSLPTLARSMLVDQWFLGETPTNPALPNDGGGLWQPAAVLLAAAAWVLLFTALRGARRTLFVATLPLLVLPTAVLVAYSLTLAPIYNPRYLSLSVPALALLLGAALARLRSLPVRTVACLLLGLLVLPVYASQRTPEAKNDSDFSRVAEYVQEHADPGDAVYFGPRRPPEGEQAEQTQRRIRTAYPQAFEELRDLSLLSSGEADGTLDGRSLLLQDTGERLAETGKLLAVRRVDYPADLLEQEDRWLASHGYVELESWTGTTNRVTVFIRTGSR